MTVRRQSTSTTTASASSATRKTSQTKQHSESCVVCALQVKASESAVQCDLCQKWCHASCPGGKQNISTELYKLLDAAGVCYLCPKCESKKDDVFDSFRHLEEFKKQVDVNLASLQKQMDDVKASMQNQIDDLKSKGVQSSPAGAPSDLQSEIKEALDREKKKNFAVIVGLPESDAQAVRSAGDKDFVLKMAHDIGIDATEVEDVFRDGRSRPDDGNRQYVRIVKIKFKESRSKLNFLKGFARAKDAGLRAYVRHDLTFRQRQEDKALKAELHEKRKQYPNDDLVIRDGKIISRPHFGARNDYRR